NISLTYIFPNAGTVVITSYLYYRNASTSGDHFPIFNSTTTSVNIPLLSINQTTTGYLSAGGALLGTPTFLQNSVSLWPNPVKDILNISSADATLKSVTITDANGRTVIQGTQQDEIDLSDLSRGVYFARIETDRGSETKKIIKQ
ncbi:MAG: T9SS type A sorting domain-containing protein, partial [Flavobacterium sp.]